MIGSGGGAGEGAVEGVEGNVLRTREVAQILRRLEDE